nr:hypothetical protein Itr_chr14CG13110 [Ipomoea trifida]
MGMESLSRNNVRARGRDVVRKAMSANEWKLIQVDYNQVYVSGRGSTVCSSLAACLSRGPVSLRETKPELNPDKHATLRRSPKVVKAEDTSGIIPSSGSANVSSAFVK